MNEFPETQRSLISRINGDSLSTRRDALSDLFKLYKPALTRFLYFKGWSQERAGDTIQGFFTDRILDGKLLNQFDAQKGRFRSFLATCLNRYAIDQWRRSRPDAAHESDAACSKDSEAQTDAPDIDIFDIAWAQQLIQITIGRMKEHCLASDQSQVWFVFESQFVRVLEGKEAIPYDEIAKSMKLRSPKQASNWMQTAKRMFRRVLLSVISEYEEEDVELELKNLLDTLQHHITRGAGSRLT
jgi:DNA-directed RNA polymerase specialized sigma24 family protein